ncbi:response regulator transcription factor [Marinobacterium rhizophilum]|uniref:Response regulator transcription factor n=1 Tax=Marinobacterium rhizophilum TaxID=420402 RepID=A0ABY5HK37_9GAMM|nr:response regulator transcription factor [Marinobacterium rhizophilum]UTW12751.1 response regulator transcription factor [Marinobacterium rhizophilum]
MTRPLNILIAHPSPLYRRGIELALDASNLPYRSTHCDHFRDLSRHWQAESGFDLLLLDDCLAGLSCLCKLKQLTENLHGSVLLCSSPPDMRMSHKLRQAGIRGVLPASMTPVDLAAAIRQFRQDIAWIELEETRPDTADLAQEPPELHASTLQGLTATELRVLNSLSKGLANKQIALNLNLSVHTVKTHLSSIFRKLNVSNRTRLVTSLQQFRLSA